MVHLHTDFINDIVGFLSTSVKGVKNSETFAAGLVSKDFAAAVQKRLFRAVDIRSKQRCASLLALLDADSTLHTFIKHIVIDDLDSREPDTAPWFLTEDGFRLLRLLSNLNSLELAEGRPRVETVVDLAAKTLASRRENIRTLQVSSSTRLPLRGLDYLLCSLPNLEELSMHDYSVCTMDLEDMEPMRDIAVATHTRESLRRMKLRLVATGIGEQPSVPSWFAQRSYLSALVELDVIWDEFGHRLCGWDLAIAASSTIVRLTIEPPHITHEIPELPLPRPLKTLNAPQLRTLRLEHVLRPQSVERTFAALSSIAPSNRIHTLCLSNRTTRGIEFYDGDNVKKYFQRLDQIISYGFPQLQRLSFELQW
jgi:hypothetical protein